MQWDEEKKVSKPVYEKVLVSDLVGNGMGMPVHNATLALRKDEWLQMDQQIRLAARQRLRAWADLRATNTFGGFNAMSKLILEHETVSDPGEAKVSMDAIEESRSDAPQYQLEGLPLPITHCDFTYSARRVAVSRNTGTPLDLTMGEAAARRVAEVIEQTTIGVITGITFGNASDYSQNPTVYGYTNHPDRATKTDLTASASFSGSTFLTEVLAMLELVRGQNHFGPYMVYVSPAYDAKLDDDLKANSDKSVRMRLQEVEDIMDVRRLDYLTGDVVLVVQMTADTARAINGMDITTVQWESKGGMQLNFKVMAIQVPQIRSDFSGNCGICHGTTA
jgi:uncharacterized linocin/CFP29 family protein